MQAGAADMGNLNGKQLYRIPKWLPVLKMGRHKALKSLPLRQKLALNYVSRESQLTRIGNKIYSKPPDKEGAEKILELCAPYDKDHLPEFFRRMGTSRR